MAYNFIKKRFQIVFFLWNLQKHCENYCENTFLRNTSSSCFWYETETYDMVELYFALDSNFFSTWIAQDSKLLGQSK